MINTQTHTTMENRINKIKRETEKAILVTIIASCFVTDQEIKRDVWFPKSQIIDNVIKDWIWDVKVKELKEE